MRPSPTESATWFMPGTYKKGNDGNLYTISINKNGVHRWIQTSNAFIPVDIQSPKHPGYIPANPVHKFKVGDTVKVINSGMGVGDKDLGEIVTIQEIGHYIGALGYKVVPKIGNSATGDCGGYIGEKSFELFETPKIQTKPLNLNKMAKATKTITKKTTQEVRQIETSLINKEEVFKMLALAEATGLPLLLVGEPGVNLN